MRRDLKRAEIYKTPEEFMRGVLKQTAMFVVGMAFLFFMVLDKIDKLIFFIPAVLLSAFFVYGAMLGIPRAKMTKIKKDIDREILFAGRFLLVKLSSGKPLLIALIEATKSFGVSQRYFQKIVSDINTGTPIEKAIEKEMDNTPSEKFQKILFQINNALKLGIDVSGPLNVILEGIAKQQKIEITKYGKKLNSIIMFYMLAAIVLPSLGITLLVVVLGLVGIPIDITIFIAGVLSLALLQFMFLTIFKGIRPEVNV